MEDFIFTAAHTELVRYTRGLCATAATDAKEDGSGQGWRGGTLGEDQSWGILEAGVFILGGLVYKCNRSLLHILALFYTYMRVFLHIIKVPFDTETGDSTRHLRGVSGQPPPPQKHSRRPQVAAAGGAQPGGLLAGAARRGREARGSRGRDA